MANRKELVAAAEDLNAVVIAPDEAIDVKQSVAKIELGIREAAKIVQPDDKLKPETLAVLAELTGQDFGAPSKGEEEDEEAEQPTAAAPSDKKARGRPAPPLGKFEPVRRGASTYAKLLEAALAGPTPLAKAIKAAGTDRDKAVSALKRARIVNGIDYSLDDKDVLTIVLPKGVDAESVWQKAKEKPASSGTKREGPSFASRVQAALLDGGTWTEMAKCVEKDGNIPAYVQKDGVGTIWVLKTQARANLRKGSYRLERQDAPGVAIAVKDAKDAKIKLVPLAA